VTHLHGCCGVKYLAWTIQRSALNEPPTYENGANEIPGMGEVERLPGGLRIRSAHENCENGNTRSARRRLKLTASKLAPREFVQRRFPGQSLVARITSSGRATLCPTADCTPGFDAPRVDPRNPAIFAARRTPPATTGRTSITSTHGIQPTGFLYAGSATGTLIGDPIRRIRLTIGAPKHELRVA
jgi:hypothetical protein